MLAEEVGDQTAALKLRDLLAEDERELERLERNRQRAGRGSGAPPLATARMSGRMSLNAVGLLAESSHAAHVDGHSRLAT